MKDWWSTVAVGSQIYVGNDQPLGARHMFHVGYLHAIVHRTPKNVMGYSCFIYLYIYIPCVIMGYIMLYPTVGSLSTSPAYDCFNYYIRRLISFYQHIFTGDVSMVLFIYWSWFFPQWLYDNKDILYLSSCHYWSTYPNVCFLFWYIIKAYQYIFHIHTGELLYRPLRYHYLFSLHAMAYIMWTVLSVF